MFCDNCDNPATNSARDLIEIDPVLDGKGRLWAQWEPFGDEMLGCDEHPTDPAKHRQNGLTIIGLETAECVNMAHVGVMRAIRKGIQR